MVSELEAVLVDLRRELVRLPDEFFKRLKALARPSRHSADSDVLRAEEVVLLHSLVRIGNEFFKAAVRAADRQSGLLRYLRELLRADEEAGGLTLVIAELLQLKKALADRILILHSVAYRVKLNAEFLYHNFSSVITRYIYRLFFVIITLIDRNVNRFSQNKLSFLSSPTHIRRSLSGRSLSPRAGGSAGPCGRAPRRLYSRPSTRDR